MMKKVIKLSMLVFMISVILPLHALAQDASSMEKTTGTGSDTSPETEPVLQAPKTKPLLEIKRLQGKDALYSIELRNVELIDFFRVIAHDYGLNILVDKDVRGKLSASLTNISLEEALETIADTYSLTVEKKGAVTIVKPNLITEVIRLNNVEASKLVDVQKDSEEGDDKRNDSIHTIYDLLSADGKILLGRELNSIVIIDYPPNVAKIKSFVLAVDRKLDSRVIQLKHISVKDVFTDIEEGERLERRKRRDERQEERDEIKEIRARVKE